MCFVICYFICYVHTFTLRNRRCSYYHAMLLINHRPQILAPVVISNAHTLRRFSRQEMWSCCIHW